MLKRIFAVISIFLMTVLSSPASAADNSVKDGAKKVVGGFKEVGKGAAEIGTNTGKAAKSAAKETGSAFGRAWDDIVKGLKKAFK